MLIWNQQMQVQRAALGGMSVETPHCTFIARPGSAPCVTIDGCTFVMYREHTGGWTLSHNGLEFVAQDVGLDTVRLAVYTKELVLSTTPRRKTLLLI